MHGFLSSITAFLLALHTVFGCCGHHAHAATEECGSAMVVESHDGRDCRHGEDCSAKFRENHEPRVCQGKSCDFLAPTKLDRHLWRLEIAGNQTAVQVERLAVARPNFSLESIFAPDALLPPLRIHLLDRVLLL